MFRILIAEDDKGTRRLMEDTLADAGYEPISAADGQEALELLTRTHVDLLILDVMMPRLDGFALLAALRCSGSQLPVLMLTAKEALADKKQGLRLTTCLYPVPYVHKVGIKGKNQKFPRLRKV